jgi:universal stress protein A
VIETIQGLSLEEVKPFYDRLERKVGKVLETMTRHAREDAPPPAGAIVRGRRAEEIVKYAAANEVDLIVLASHRVNPSAVDRDWGTISYKVGLLAQCPVLLVK